MPTRNPTRTMTIEKAWKREINRRWRAYTRRVSEQLDAMNSQALAVNAAGDPFVMSAAQQRTYMVFVEAEIERLLLGALPPDNWQNQYQLEGYQRGLETTRAALLAQGAEIVPTEVERLAATGLQPFTTTPTLGTPTTAPIHRDALEFLYQRSYSSLKGWTDALAVQTRQILFDGAEQGLGIEVVTRNMVDRIGVSRSSARRIAQTETNQAFSRSAINETNRASEEIGKDVRLRWLTVMDSRVRHAHAELHGVVMDTGRAAGVKRTDGINCRCGLAPVIPRADTAAKRAKFTAERDAMLLIERR